MFIFTRTLVTYADTQYPTWRSFSVGIRWLGGRVLRLSEAHSGHGGVHLKLRGFNAPAYK
jgi:hypothetical protein